MPDKMQTPAGWKVVRLGDVADVLDARRVPLNADERAKMTGVYPYYGANGVVDHIDRWIFDENDDLVLLAEDGGHFDEFTTKPIAYRVKGKCWVNNHAHVLKANDYTLGNFLFYSLVNKDIRPFINGTTRSKLTQADLRQVEIGLPPLPEQRAIAAVLDSIDEAIERTEAVIAATERLRDALLHQLLTRGVPGWHTQWKDVPGIGTIPAGWEVVRLGDVAEVQTGRAVNLKALQNGNLEAQYLSVANVKDGYLDLGVVKTMLVAPFEINRYRLQNGDADKLGRGTVWQNEIDLCLHRNHIFAVRPRQGTLYAEFLAVFAASIRGKQYFLGAAKQTTNLASMNATQLR